MTPWKAGETAGDNPNRDQPGNPNITDDVKYQENQNGQNETDHRDQSMSLEDEDTPEDLTPQKRLKELNSKLDDTQKQVAKYFPGLSKHERKELLMRLAEEKPLEDILDSINTTGSSLQDAKSLAKKPKNEGMRKSGKRKRPEESREEDQYSRTNDFSRQEKSRDQRRERDRREDIQPNW